MNQSKSDEKALDPKPLNHRYDSFNKGSYWSKKYEDILLGPYNYMTELPGKGVRSKLIQAFNTILQVPQPHLDTISEIVGMLHTASLLVDDVEDSSTLRRGFPVAHSIFGTAQTINSSNYIYFLALQKVVLLQSTSAINTFTEELVNLHRGQGLDLYWRDTLTCPTEEEYLDMVMNKTGGLYRLAVRLMQDVSPVNIDLIPLANVLGIIYQIQDDYLNLQSKTYTDNKGFCEDITEGKFSFPIIHSISFDTSNKQIVNILKQKTEDYTLKKYAVDYMRKTTKSFEYTQTVLESYTQIAEKMINELAQSEYKTRDSDEDKTVDVKALRQILSLMRSIC